MNVHRPNWKQVSDVVRGRIHAHASECPRCLPDDRGESANAPSLARGPRLDPIGESLVSTECADGLQLLGELLTALNHRIAAGDLDHPLGRSLSQPARVRLGDEP